MNKKILFGLFVLFFILISFKIISAEPIICNVGKYVYSFNEDGNLGCYDGPKCSENFQSDCQCTITDFCNSSQNKNCSISSGGNECIKIEDKLDCEEINQNYLNKTQAQDFFNGDEDLDINFKKVQNTPNNLECYEKKPTCEEAGGILIKNTTEICPTNNFEELNNTLKVSSKICVEKDNSVICDYSNYCKINGESYFIYNIGNVSSIRVKPAETGVNDERFNCSKTFKGLICDKIFCLANSANNTYYDPNNVGKRLATYFFNRDDFGVGYKKAQNVCGSFNYSKCVQTLNDYSIDNTIEDQKLIYCRSDWLDRNNYWKDKFSAKYFCKGVDSYLSKLRNEDQVSGLRRGLESTADALNTVTDALGSWGYDSQTLAGWDIITGGRASEDVLNNVANVGYNKFATSWNNFLDSISSPVKNALYSWCKNMAWTNPYLGSNEEELIKANMRLNENAVIDFSSMKWKRNESNSEYFYYFQWSLGTFSENVTYFFCLSDEDDKDDFTFNNCKNSNLRVGHFVNNSQEGENDDLEFEELNLAAGQRVNSLDVENQDAIILADKDYKYVYFCIHIIDDTFSDFNRNVLNRCHKKEPLEYIDYVVPNLGEINKTKLNEPYLEEGIALAIE